MLRTHLLLPLSCLFASSLPPTAMAAPSSAPPESVTSAATTSAATTSTVTTSAATTSALITGAASCVGPSISASRVDGVAPLSVYFDALANIGDPLTGHVPYFQWYFDDPRSAHPMATGYAAAHVFEQPGLYHVLLGMTDASGAFSYSMVPITVRPFVGTTFYVSAAGNDGNDGRSEATAFRTFDRGSAALLGAIPRNGVPTAARLLLRRGDTFTTANGCNFNTGRTGDPILVGAYGTGAKPVIARSSGNPIFAGYGRTSNVRFVDLELRGQFDFGTGANVGMPLMMFFEGTERLLLRCTLRNAESGYVETGGEIDRRTHVALFDCEIYDMYTMALYIGGRGLALVGNRMERAWDAHICRVWLADGGVITGNVFMDPSVRSGTGRHALKLHSPTNSAIHTQNVVVAGNVFRGSAWTVTIGPQDDQSRQLVENVIFERNVLLPDALSSRVTQVHVIVYAQNVTVRSNLFVATPREASLLAVQVKSWTNTGLPAPRNVRLHGNTVVHTSSDPRLWACLLHVEAGGAGALEAIDNLVYAGNAGRGNGIPCVIAMLSGGFRSSELTAHHNLMQAPASSGWIWDNGNTLSLSTWQQRGQGTGSVHGNAGFVNIGRWDVRPSAASAAKRGGCTVNGLRDDLLGARRDLTPGVAIGALQ